MGGAGKMTRIQTFKSFEIRKWKGVKREHSTAVPWSPDLLRGQGSTHETFQQPEVLKRNSFTVYSGETKPDDPTGDHFRNSVAALRSKEDADWILYWRTTFSDKLQLTDANVRFIFFKANTWVSFPLLMSLLFSRFLLLQNSWCVFVGIAPLCLQLGSNLDDYVWNVQCAPHVGRFRPQTLTAPHPTEHPPQQEQLRGQPEQCQGNGLIRQARFTAPPCPAPAHIVSQDLAWKLSRIGDNNWTAGNPS